jgi:hypothetical protein
MNPAGYYVDASEKGGEPRAADGHSEWLPSALKRRNAPLPEMGHHRLIRFPSVGELRGDTEVHGVDGRVGVEQFGDAGPGDDDAGVPVAGGENAEAASLEVEGGRIAAAGQRMKDDHHVELAALQTVRGVGNHLEDAQFGEGTPDG